MALFNALVDEAIRTQDDLAVLRPGDIAWLYQGGIEPAYELIDAKLADHAVAKGDFLENIAERLKWLESDKQQQKDFIYEMSRFIPPDRLNQTVKQDGFWHYLVSIVTEKAERVQQLLQNGPSSRQRGPLFPM